MEAFCTGKDIILPHHPAARSRYGSYCGIQRVSRMEAEWRVTWIDVQAAATLSSLIWDNGEKTNEGEERERMSDG